MPQSGAKCGTELGLHKENRFLKSAPGMSSKYYVEKCPTANDEEL